MKKIITAVFVTLMCASSPGFAAEYAIVVHSANNYSASDGEARQLVKRLYLKEITDWPSSGEAVRFYTPGSSDPAMSAFVDKVLGMTEASVASHWLNVKQQTGETPPREVPSARMLQKLVERYEGALGVVPADAVSGDVRVLFKFTD